MSGYCCRLAMILLAACGLVFSGCKSGVSLAPVKGTVTLDDRPLAKGTIRFESSAGRPATGNIVDGQIVELTTFKPGDGVLIGSHKVAIWATEDAASAVVPHPGEGKGPGYMSGKSLIDAIYNDPETSGLTADIQAGDNVVAFKLTSKPSQKEK